MRDEVDRARDRVQERVDERVADARRTFQERRERYGRRIREVLPEMADVFMTAC